MEGKTKVGVIVGIIVAIALVAYFLLAIYCPSAGMYVRAEKLTNAPANYVEINITELDKYPFVKEAVMNPGKEIKVPSSDSSMSDFAEMLWDANRTQNIKIGQDYYQILIFCAD